MNKLVLLFSLLAMGCGQCCNVVIPKWDDAVYCYKPAQTNGVRLVVIHGMNGVHENLWNNEPYASMMHALQDSGYEITMFDNPQFNPRFFEDKGALYQILFLERMNKALRQGDNCFGHRVTITVTIGVSFGGLHSMVAAKNIPEITAFAALIPVVRLNNLNIPSVADFSLIDNTSFNSDLELEKYKHKPGFISWSDNDETVNYRLAASLYQSMLVANQNVAHQTYHNADHSIDMNYTPLLQWLGGIK